MDYKREARLLGLKVISRMRPHKDDKATVQSIRDKIKFLGQKKRMHIETNNVNGVKSCTEDIEILKNIIKGIRGR